MEKTREEFMEYVRKNDLAKIVALDISIFSRSLNAMIYGRIQRVVGGAVSIHTGIDFQYTLDISILGQQRMDVFFVKSNKRGVEYISNHFSFCTKSPCTDMVAALISKIKTDGGTPSKIFPNRKLGKCLGEEVIKVEDREEDELEAYYGYGGEYTGSIYDDPYTGHRAFSREKRFYFKECGRKAITSA